MDDARVPSGVVGLDEILGGGFVPRRTYAVRGGPGTGKTTLGLHCLIQGVAQGEKVLFISLGEPETEVRMNAERLGFDLSGVEILDLSPGPEFFAEVETYDIFSPAEVEREPTTKRIVSAIETMKPARVFLDAMTQFRYLSTDAFQFRKQVLSFFRFLVERGATVLFSSESSVEAPDDDLQFMCDGVISLSLERGNRWLEITKLRKSSFRGGRHALRLTDSGMVVYPRLIPTEFGQAFVPEAIPSGLPELDEMLHGGLERGTITIITGPSGAGKTTLGLQFMKEAAGRGERSVIFTFEEGMETLVHRSESIGIPISAMRDQGTLAVVPVEPMRYGPDEFASLARREVDEKGTRVVMVDSTSGYGLSLSGEDLVSHLHALSKYLVNMGVTVILVNEVSNITGDFRVTESDISYMADNIVFLRYLEIDGELRKAIGVLKKRVSDFEKRLREYEITGYGIKVGAPLSGLRGILLGTPEWVRRDGG